MQPFFREKNNHQGMTLIEVLVVLALLAVVLVPAINALTATNRIWSHNSAINPCITQANATMTWISREIRGAAQPSSSVNSVLVEEEGKRLIIYRYNETTSKWEKIIYQINTDNQLKKIILSEVNPADVISAAIPAENASGWTTLLEGVTSHPVFTRPENSRMVEINLQVSDCGQTNERFAPFDLASTYMIRSREVGAITGKPVPDETEPTVVLVHKIIINPTSTRMIITEPDTHEKDINVTEIWPANATDKSVEWKSSHPDWVTVKPGTDSLHATMKLMKKERDWGYLEFPNPSWQPPDVTITATATTGGASATCEINIDKWWWGV